MIDELTDFANRLREIDGYLCPEPGNCWSVPACDGTSDNHIFTGWGWSPTEALEDAEKQYKEYQEEEK